MPRKPREYSFSNVYHIIFRGNNKQNIFYDSKDRQIFLNIIKITKEKFNYEVYAYCLMTNHVHMVIKVDENFLSKSMQNLGLRYSIYFNKKFNKVGHLFQDRFFSRKVEKLSYFLNVCKYIHRNPETANINKTEDYEWSSFQEYLSKKANNIVNRKVLLNYYNYDINEFKIFSLTNNDEEYLLKMQEYELIKKLSEEEVIDIIKKKYKLKDTKQISLLGKIEKEEIIRELKKMQGTNITQISKTIGVSRYYIETLK